MLEALFVHRSNTLKTADVQPRMAPGHLDKEAAFPRQRCGTRIHHGESQI